MTTALTRRAGPLFGVVLLLAGMAVAVSPLVPAASAVDPTPAPSVVETPPAETPSPSAAPDPTVTPTADPTAEPTPAPSADPTSGPTADPSSSPDATPSASPDPGMEPSASPDPGTPAGGLTIDHFWIDREDIAGAVAEAGAMDSPMDLARFVVYRVRFQVVNRGTTPLTVTPALQAGTGSVPGSWTAVPEVDPAPGEPFYAASDKGGTWDVRHMTINAASLRLDRSADTTAVPVDGIASAGENPAPSVTLPAHSYTEIQFAVRATQDAGWGHAYALRLTLAGSAVEARVDAPAGLGAAPAVILTPGQKPGTVVDDAVSGFTLKPPAIINARLASATMTPRGGFALASGSHPTPHVVSSLTSDTCAACHGTHTAQGPLISTEASPVATMCFTCHDGTGADANIRAQYSGATANNPAADEWYAHPATASSNHTTDQDTEEFNGITNRHAQCADCHQPHLSDDTLASETAGGWTASGAIKGASGVAIVNGAAGSSPAYTWQKSSTLEYQLCFKCHSGYTTLGGENATNPSRAQLDKAIELNPANLSYHPIEAAGKTNTVKMAASLSGSSPYKQWTFATTSTIRCANCHATSTATTPAVDARLDNHTSANRGILLRSYRDRTLLGRLEPYDATNFALCFLCHAEAPMVDTSGNASAESNFRTHGLHTSGIAGGPAGASAGIDVDGAGSGNATCAECHFRTHGSAFPANSTPAQGGQVEAGGLVNFAPDVQPFNGVIQIVRRTPTSLGTCTLTCHGKPHDHFLY